MDCIIPKVSVVVPVFNADRFLDECLESLHRQTLGQMEFILVNDGSTDRSEEICRSFQQRDPRFMLINQKNGGSAAARKAGMLAAKGEYLGFVDADDWCEDNMFETMYRNASENNSDIVFCNCFRDFPDRSIKCNKYIRDGAYDRRQILEEILPRTLAGLDAKGRSHVIRWANYLRLYRREIIERHNIYNDPRFRRCQDLQLTFEATLHAQSYFYLGDEFLYHNRVTDDSQSRGYTKDCWNKLRILIERLYEDVEHFKETDLRGQMDLCAFFFAVYSCENECRGNAPLTPDERKEKLLAICNDPLTDSFLPGVPYERLSHFNRNYYSGLQKKDHRLLEKAFAQARRQGVKSLYLSKALSCQWFKKLYMLLRHRN